MIERRPFGRTGHMSSCTIFGAAALGRVSQDDAERTLDLLLEYEVNHIDTANSYGESERRIGPWMARHRSDVFLATKTEERSYQGARDHLHRSLDLLRTDHVDLWQLHCLVDPIQWETAMGPGGALEAFVEAKEQGLVRFLGVTGHGTVTPSIHRRSLERYNFDAILLPYNYAMMQNESYAADFESLLSLCAERQTAVQTIKSICRGPWGSQPHTRSTWYEPLEDQREIDAAVAWVLRRSDVFLNTAGDINLLPRILDAATRWQETVQAQDVDRAMTELSLDPLFV